MFDIKTLQDIEDLMYKGRKAKFFSENYINDFNVRMAQLFVDKPVSTGASFGCSLIGEYANIRIFMGIPPAEEGMVGSLNYSRMSHVLHILNPDTATMVRLCLVRNQPLVLAGRFSECDFVDEGSGFVHSADQVSVDIYDINYVKTLHVLQHFQNFLCFVNTFEGCETAIALH